MAVLWSWRGLQQPCLSAVPSLSSNWMGCVEMATSAWPGAPRSPLLASHCPVPATPQCICVFTQVSVAHAHVCTSPAHLTQHCCSQVVVAEGAMLLQRAWQELFGQRGLSPADTVLHSPFKSHIMCHLLLIQLY